MDNLSPNTSGHIIVLLSISRIQWIQYGWCGTTNIYLHARELVVDGFYSGKLLGNELHIALQSAYTCDSEQRNVAQN
jgi:hypothetical protein